MGIKEHLRKAMVVLLTVAMVSQQSPVVYAVENYSGSSDNESVETYTNDSNENVDENVGSEDEANDQSDDVSDDQSDNENSDQPEGIFDFFGSFFGGVTGQSEEDTLEIEVQFGHSYIEYLDQVIAPPASKLKVPRDTELRFRAYADSGYEILGVSYMADGVKYDLAYDEQTDEYIVDSSLLQGTPILVVSAIEASEGELQGLSLHYLDENFLNLNDDLNVDGEDNDSNGFDESDENDNADNESNGTNSFEDVSDGEEVVEGNTDSEKSDSDEEQVEEEEQSDDTVDEKKAAEEDENEEEAEEPATRTTYEYEDRQVKVVATVEDPEAIPDNAELVVHRVTKYSEGYNYDAYMDALNESSDDMNYDDENTLLYDVAFKVPKTDEDGNVVDGEFIEIQPAEGAVAIEISFKRYQLQDKLEAKEDEDVEIKHLPLVDSVRDNVDSTEDATDITSSDIKVEDVDNTVDVENEMVSLTAESFSVFSVTVTNGGKATIQLQFKDKNGNAASHTINKHLYTFVKTNDNKRAILELENKGNGRYSVSFDKLEGKQLSGQTQLEAEFWLTDKSNVSGTDQNSFDFNRGDIHLTNGELIDGYLLTFPKDSVIYSGDTYTVEASKDSSAMATIELKFLDEHGAQVDQTVDGVLYAYVTSKNWTKGIFKLDKDDQGTYSTSFVKLGNTGLDDSYDLAVTLYLTPNEIQTDQPSQLTNNGGRELQDGSTVVGTYILNCPDAATFKLGQIYEFEAAPPAPSQDAESQLSGSGNDFFKSILGPNLNYGIVTETFDLSEGDAETNVAAISGKCVNQTGNDLTNPVEQTFILAEVIDEFKIKEQNAYVMTPASEVSKIEGLGNCTVTFDTSRNKQELTSMVQSMLGYAANQSETLAAHQNTASLVRNSEGKYVVDLTNRGSGVFYVTINDSSVFSASFGQSEGLQIIKDDNQVIVFNITLDNPGDVWKYKLKDQGADSFITEHSHEVPSTIVYNFTNATSVPLKGSVTAIVLAPKATVTTYGTGAGWLICKNVIIASGEWHNVYQEIEQVRVGSNAFIKATKRVNNRNATSDESGFKFKLEQKDGDNWKTVQQTTNVASAINFYAVSFNEHNFTASGDSQDFIYRVSEVAESKGVGGRTITTDSTIYYVKITVSKVTTHTGNTDVTSYSASVPMYYRDEACTQAVSEAVFNNTYQGSSNKEGAFELKGKKVMAGRSFQSGDSWTFTVEAPEGTPMPENTSVTINPTTGTSAEFSFGNIVFNESQHKNHTYTYTIKETKSDKNDIVYDESQKIVKLTVSDNGGATLVVTPTDGGGQNVISDLTSYLTFTNTFVEKTSASVSKVWVDGGNQDPLRPTSVTVKLKANGADVSPVKTVVLNESNNWSHTENNLPKKDDNGNVIAYTWVEEDVPSGYRMTSNTANGSTTITNTELTESTVVKNWNDANNGNQNRPGSVTVELKANGEDINGMQPVTLNAGNNWTHTVENLPKYDNNGLINYTWVETSNIAGYTTPTVTKSGTTTTITNSEEKTSLTVVKNWNDNGDPDHMRPINLTVNLMKGNTVAGTVTLNEDNDWRGTVDNLPVYENGQKITYTWVEDKTNVHPTYQEGAPAIDNETNTTTLTNTYTREYTTATVHKVWEDENDRRKLRPASLTVNLMNGEDVAGTVTLSASNNWTDVLDNLPKYAYGKLIDYQWQEASLPEGYTLTSTAHDENDSTITTLTNTYNAEETELTVKKVWNDANNQDGIRPESITVKLLENGKDSGKSVTLSEANKWEAKLSDLPVKKGGQTITYSWSESGLRKEYEMTGNETVGTITTLTNTHETDTVDLTVKKAWNDSNNQDGSRPVSITVNLEKLENGKYEAVDTVILNKENEWQGTVTGLPKKADGVEIQYRWVEVVPNGYGATYTTAEGEPNTTIITNTHDVEKTSVSVKKVWNDGNNQDGIRPASITAVLLADGVETNESITLNEANNWQGTIDNLDVYKDGKAIAYSFKEVAIQVDRPGQSYSSVITDDGKGNFTITNSHTPETISTSVLKKWTDDNNRDGKRPASITVKLKGGDFEKEYVLNEDNNWFMTVTNLPKYANGEAITYEWTEETSFTDYTAKEPQVNQVFTILGKTFANTTILENTHTTETTEATVVKEWNDNHNQDGKRTDSVTVKLQANGKDVEGQNPVVLNKDNNWTATISNLPKYADGEEIAYTWVEDPVPADYTPEVSVDKKSNTTTITNSHTPELTTSTVMKKWSDSGNQDGVRPNSIKVILQADGKDIKTVELKGDSWTHIENDLPKYADGNEIEYKWVEVQEQEDWAKNYELTNTLVEGTVTTFTNKHEVAKTQSTVKKVWDDKNNQDKVRPASIEVTLYANGKATETVATLSETNRWTYTKTDLDKFENGTEIVYTWVEDDKASENGYALVQEKTGVSEDNPTLYTITNKRETDKTDATIKKVWNDTNNQDGKRPESLVVTLKDGDKEVGKVTLSDANDWTGTVTGLEKNRDGSPIAYAWAEDKLPEGYTLTNTTVDGTVTTITNSYNTEKTSATVEKVWKDSDNQDGIRPETLTVKLLADGKDTGKSVILTEAKNWTDTISNLDVYEAGKVIKYTWSEEGLPKGYTLGEPSVNGTITTLTNTHTPDETSVSISKVWDDNNNNDNMRPESITVDLMDGKEKVGSVVLTEAEGWHGEVTGLQKYRDGQLITYTWAEHMIDGYTGKFSKDENGNPVLTNKHEAETTDVSVTKVWDDNNNQDGKRPSAVIVTLLANGEPLAGKTYELNAGNNWTAEEKGLPKYLNKELISYTWREDKVDYYTLDGYVTKKGVTTLTNTHTPETISLSVEKIFEDNNNQDGVRPKSVVVNLLADGRVVATETLNSENEWKASETNLPKYADGKEIVYVWEEVVPDGYTASYDKDSDASSTTVVTNKHETEETSISVQKVWDDDNNRDGIRPTSITVNLLADGAFKKSITLSAANNWHEKVEQLAAKHDGKAIVYSIKEVAVNGYDSEISKETSNDGKVNFTITNTHKIAETEATVTKVWNDSDNQDGKRPANLVVTLNGNGNPVGSVTLTAENNWTAKLEHLPVNDNGKKITYAWTEGNMPEGYAFKSSETVGTVTTITNTYDTDTTSASVHKEWDDANNQDGIRPASLTVKLLADGKDTGRTVTLNNANGWAGTISGLDKFRDNGVEIVYTWEEPQVEGYNKATAVKSDNSTVLTNTHTTDETTATVQKVWEDDDDNDGKRPESVTVNLMDGTTVKETVVLSKANNWTYTVKNLEKNRAGKPIKYTWEEVNLPDSYKLIGNNTVGTITTLTNEHKNETTEATIKKVWDDSENQDGKRPGEIVAVLSNGTEVTLNATNHWTYTVTDLPKYENGAEIKYTWSEKAVPDGYTLTGNSTQGTITTLTNAHEAEKKNLSIQKVWKDNNNQDGIRPAEITVALLANGKDTEHSVTLNSANDWKATVQGLDVYAGGSEIVYTWSEAGLPEGYKLSDPVTNGNLTTLTNTNKTEKTSVSVQKVWDDNNDQDGVRPESITVKLLADGVEKELITLDASNDWYKKIDGLDAKRDEGQAIAYTFEEVKVDGYKTEIKDDGKGNFTITNTHTVEKTDLTIKKEWHDNNNQDGARPTELQVTLTADGEVRETITLNEENKWTATVKDLPAYKDGEKIEYAWSEDNVALASKEYKLTKTDVSDDGTETTFHNTYKAKETSATVTKVWDDDDNRDGSRPESLTVKLQADGEDTGKSVTLNADNDWTATLDKLDAYKSGQLITYTWKEVDLPEGYKLDNTSVNGTVTTIKNIHESAKTEAKVVKVWNDDDNNDGKRPASITVKLLADGKETGDTAVLNKGNEWTATITGLDAKKGGKDIKYTWAEDEEGLPDGYALESNETKGTVTTITNKYENETTEASVIKVWDDNNDQDKIRPDSLAVVLSEGTEVVLNEQNGWTGKVENLPKFKDGKEIEYTWTEKDLPEGYRLTNTSKEGTVTTLTNTHGAEETSVTVKKVWDDDNNRDGLRPTSITLTLNTGDAVTLNAQNNWTATISGLPKYSNGKLISYSWVEKSVPVGYTVTGNVTDGMVTTITNKHVSDVTKTSVKKVWDDNDNQDGLRPASLTVTLLADGKNYQDVTLDQSNGWTAELNNLPKFDKGVPIKYTWSEPKVANYSAETKVDASTNAWTFTNTHVTYTTRASVRKVWDDKNDQDKVRPKTLSVDLMANGNTVTTVTLSEPDWSATVNDLPLKSAGVDIDYTWKEASIDGYRVSNTQKDGVVTTLTNTHDTQKTSATVKKVWDDDNDRDGDRPQAITVELMADGEATGQTVTLSGENNWTATISGLEAKKAGVDIAYTWNENTVPTGYTLEGNKTEGTVTTITNAHTTLTRTATVKKVWDDKNNQDGQRPKTLEVTLMGNGDTVETVTLSEDNKWTATVDNLPVNANGSAITYAWVEGTMPSGYALVSSEVDPVDATITTLTNTYDTDSTSATVRKSWDDSHNQDGIRPDVIEVTLYANGVSTKTTAKLTDSNGWQATVTGLDKFADGKEIAYTWAEDKLPEGYELTDTAVEGTVTTLTNTHVAGETEATVKKVWDDAENQDGLRPESLTVTLSNGTEVELNEANQWTATVEHLPKYADGKEITYNWSEGKLPEGYELTDTSVEGTVTTLTNTHVAGETEATVKKVWDDAENQDGLRPESLTVTLSNGTEVELNEANQWAATVEHLPKYADGKEITYNWSEGKLPEGYELTDTSVEGTVTTLTNTHVAGETEATVKKVWDDAEDQDGIRPAILSVALSNGAIVNLSEANQWTATVEHLPKYADGKEITYTWTEGALPEGYELTDTSVEGTVTTLTNSHKAELTEATVKKIWNDANNRDGLRPESLDVTLSNGAKVTLNEENDWTATVKNLPKYANGTEIEYTWTEGNLPEGYELTDTTVNGTVTTLTNTHEAATTEATIVKVWNDRDNQDGIRPSELTVTLSNGMPVVLSARNDWSATVTGLPKYDNGTEIEYTWTEGALPAGYTLSGTNVNGTVTTLTNTHVAETTEATVRKVWDDKDNQDGIRPATLTVTLSNGNTVTLNEANSWTATISDLPKYDRGTAIEYTWTESNLPDGYELTDTSVNGTVTTLTNTHETEVTEASVKKVWNDEDNKDGKRPKSLTVTLSNGTEVTLNEENEWAATVNDLPMYANGEKVVYAWTEGEMPAGYTLTDTSVDGTVTTLTNSYDTEETSATITKVWAGDEGLNVRPNNLMATLSNGTVVLLNAANNWTATVSNLPAYEAGQLITYTWSEGNMPQGYELTDTSVNGTITTLTNTYKGKDSVTLNGTKKIEGREFVEGDEFTFTVTADEGTPMPKDTTVTITPTAGNEYAVDFGEITYTLADAGKTYTYTITETGEVEGVTNDEPQTVKVTIVDNGDGTITAQRDADTASFTFTNTYAAAGTLELSGKKFMDGRELTEDDVFEFTVTDEDGNVTTVSNEGEAIAYKPIAYTIKDLGTHTYTIAETAYDKDGVKSDTNVYVLTVEVTDNHDGTLSASTSGADAGNLDFTNTYTATADAEIKAHKTLTGRKLVADQFKFTLAGEGIEDQTKTNNADGNVVFDKITYTAEDLADAEVVEGVRSKTFEYTITEVDDGQDGYSYDAALQNVTVTVTDDMKGNMTATVAYADDREVPEFLNTYRAADTNAVLEAHKVLEGNGLRQLADREFTFDLMDEEGEVIATAYNDADGNVAFAPISYNFDTFVDENGVFVGKTFSYTIAERKGDETGITYDENTYKATVTVSDDGKGQLVAAVAYELGEAPTFTNTYAGSSTTITFDKYYFGSNANAAFDFIITAADEKGEPRVNADGTSVEHTGDAEIVDEGQAFTVRFKNGAFAADSLAEVTSPEISYAKAGTYYYTLTEADHEDPVTYLITVKVANNGSVEKTYQMLDGEDNEAVETMELFNNETELLTFRSMSMGAMGAPQHVASAMPKVGKVFENGKLEDGKFTFQLMDEDKKNVLQEATNAADGEVKFDRITYTAPGTYKYVIVEKEGKDKTVVYDDTEINYTVTVAEDADGELLVSEQYSVDEKVTEDPTFTNKARTIIIRARKKSREAPYDPLNGSTYGIWMANPDGNDVYMGSDISHIDLKIEGDTGGWLDYNVPTTPGVAYYLLEEAAPHGHLVDPYPTDYFTIASNEDGYYLVYQSDPKFFELVPDLKGKI